MSKSLADQCREKLAFDGPAALATAVHKGLLGNSARSFVKGIEFERAHTAELVEALCAAVAALELIVVTRGMDIIDAPVPTTYEALTRIRTALGGK